MIYPVPPCPKPRMTRADVWKKRPAVIRYRAFADAVRAAGVSIHPFGSHVTFHIQMPDSWSESKKSAFDGHPHTQRPDIDNLLKALFDALFDDDSHITDIRATKVWARTGAIEIELTEMEATNGR